MGKGGKPLGERDRVTDKRRASKGGLFKSRRVFGYAIRTGSLGLDQPMYL